MGRAPCCEKVGLKKGRWTAEEDEILLKYIEANGEGSWRSLPKNAGLLRCGKSCRLRWINYLRTDLKRGNISAEEEDTIVKLHASLGNKWSLIASQFPGRTDNEIKNYWNSHLSRKIYPFRRPAAIQDLPIIMNLAKTSTGSKRKGSKTNTRPSMKKTKSTTHTDSATAPQENVTLPSDHISWKEKKNESMLLDSCAADQQGEERIVLNLVNVPGPYQDTRAEERESTQGTLCHCDEERESNNNSNSMLCCPIDERQTAMLGPYNEGEFLDDSGVLSFNDINMDNIELLDPNGFLSLSCEQQKRDQDDLIFMDYSSSKMATSEDIESGNLSSNGESSGTHHELLSCSSTSYFDHDHHGRVVWEWEDVVNGHDNQMVDKQEDGQMLSWLWESNDWERECQEFGGEMDKYCEKQKAMVDWLLS